MMVLFWCLVFEGGETEKTGKNKTETVTASRAYSAGKGLLPGGCLVVQAPTREPVVCPPGFWFWACFLWLVASWAATLTSWGASLGVGWGWAGLSHMPRERLAVEWLRV